MTLDKFMKYCIHQTIKLAAEDTADTTNNPDDAAKIPSLFFRIEQALLTAWEAIYEEEFRTPNE